MPSYPGLGSAVGSPTKKKNTKSKRKHQIGRRSAGDRQEMGRSSKANARTARRMGSLAFCLLHDPPLPPSTPQTGSFSRDRQPRTQGMGAPASNQRPISAR